MSTMPFGMRIIDPLYAVKLNKQTNKYINEREKHEADYFVSQFGNDVISFEPSTNKCSLGVFKRKLVCDDKELLDLAENKKVERALLPK